MATHRGIRCIFLVIVLLCTPLSTVGSRVLRGHKSSLGHLQVTQLRLPWDQLIDQVKARADYFESLAGNSLSVKSLSVSNFAVNPVQLGRGYLSAVSSFTVNVKLGSPGVSVPLIVDTGSHLSFVQGTECVSCVAGSPDCGTNPYSGPSSCPYTGALYDPSQSSTANAELSCSDCSGVDSLGYVGCLGKAFSASDTCQFGIRFGGGYAAGQYLQDTLSIGSVTAANVFFGTTVFENKFDGVAGLLGFGPTEASLPFQLKSSGAVSTANFALCLASGKDTGGSLFLGGVPSQPSGQAYALSYTPILQSPSVYYVIGAPTDFLVGGVSASGAVAALATETFPQTNWIVDSGTTLSYLPTAIHSAIFASLATAVGCPNTFVNLQGSGLDFIDLSTCSPPFSSAPSYAEVYSRFPSLTLTLQGVSLTARPKGYAILGRYGPQGQYCMNPGIADVGTSSVRIIGDSFMSDNMIVYDNDNQRLGFAPVDCNTLAPLDLTAVPVASPTSAPSSPPPTSASPYSPPTIAPSTPPSTTAPSAPPPTTAPSTPPSTTAPSTPPSTTASPTPPATTAPSSPPPMTASPSPPPTTTAPTPSSSIAPAGAPAMTDSSLPPSTAQGLINPPPTASAPTSPPPTTALSTPPPTTPLESYPPPTAPAPSETPTSTNSPPTIPAPTTPPAAIDPPMSPPLAPILPSTPPPVTGTPIPPPPSASFPSEAPVSDPPGAETPTYAPPIASAPFPPPTTAVASTPPPAAILVAPSSPPSSASPTSAPLPNVLAAGGSCDPYSSTPNQCYNNVGTFYVCCSGSCPPNPSSTPTCATPLPAVLSSEANVYSTGGVCDSSSPLPNQCYNHDGSLYTCCAGSCASTPGPVPACD